MPLLAVLFGHGGRWAGGEREKAFQDKHAFAEIVRERQWHPSSLSLNVGSKTRTRADEAALVGLVLQDEPESFQASRPSVSFCDA